MGQEEKKDGDEPKGEQKPKAPVVSKAPLTPEERMKKAVLPQSIAAKPQVIPFSEKVKQDMKKDKPEPEPPKPQMIQNVLKHKDVKKIMTKAKEYIDANVQVVKAIAQRAMDANAEAMETSQEALRLARETSTTLGVLLKTLIDKGVISKEELVKTQGDVQRAVDEKNAERIQKQKEAEAAMEAEAEPESDATSEQVSGDEPEPVAAGEEEKTGS